MLTQKLSFAALLMAALAARAEQSTTPADPFTSIDGAAVYKNHCGSCHDAGIDGAPALGDQAAWAPRVPEWSEVLKDHATRGFLTMQPMGGTLVLSEDAVGAAVDYIAAQVKPTHATGVVEDLSTGRAVYAAECSACHDTGASGAPKLGDDAAWAERSPFWESVLDEHVEKGFFEMPARANLSTEQIKQAVDYMISWESVP